MSIDNHVVAKDKKIFSLTDKGTGIHVNVKADDLKCKQILVDGGAISTTTEKKCDWCIRIYEETKPRYKLGTCLFIELKGSDFRKAYNQIINTILWFRKNVPDFKITKQTYVVMRGKIPRLTSSDQVLMLKFKSEYKSELRGVHSKTQLVYPETAI